MSDILVACWLRLRYVACHAWYETLLAVHWRTDPERASSREDEAREAMLAWRCKRFGHEPQVSGSHIRCGHCGAYLWEDVEFKAWGDEQWAKGQPDDIRDYSGPYWREWKERQARTWERWRAMRGEG